MVTIAEIKSTLHQQIANTEDKETLEKVKAFFDSLSAKTNALLLFF